MVSMGFCDVSAEGFFVGVAALCSQNNVSLDLAVSDDPLALAISLWASGFKTSCRQPILHLILRTLPLFYSRKIPLPR